MRHEPIRARRRKQPGQPRRAPAYAGRHAATATAVPADGGFCDSSRRSPTSVFNRQYQNFGLLGANAFTGPDPQLRPRAGHPAQSEQFTAGLGCSTARGVLGRASLHAFYLRCRTTLNDECRRAGRVRQCSSEPSAPMLPTRRREVLKRWPRLGSRPLPTSADPSVPSSAPAGEFCGAGPTGRRCSSQLRRAARRRLRPGGAPFTLAFL